MERPFKIGDRVRVVRPEVYKGSKLAQVGELCVVREYRDCCEDIYVEGKNMSYHADRFVIDSEYVPPESSDVNADLLEACKAILEAAIRYRMGQTSIGTVRQIHAAEDLAKAAIAKATKVIQ